MKRTECAKNTTLYKFYELRWYANVVTKKRNMILQLVKQIMSDNIVWVEMEIANAKSIRKMSNQRISTRRRWEGKMCKAKCTRCGFENKIRKIQCDFTCTNCCFKNYLTTIINTPFTQEASPWNVNIVERIKVDTKNDTI